MKKFLTIAGALVATATCSFGQGNDTLLFETFSGDLSNILSDAPSGINQTWINFDEDGLGDANSRPQEWAQSTGFADQDSTNDILMSSSWLANANEVNRNWLMTPPISIIDSTAVLYWKSAPYQLPKYMDGYKVVVSVTNNVESSFTDTIAVFAEYLQGDENTPFVFSSGIMHTAFQFNADTLRHTGILQQWEASLANYAGKTIYVAFLHDSHDDNLISLDDVLIKGTKATGIKTLNSNLKTGVYPNPASRFIQAEYALSETSSVRYSIIDVNGKEVESLSRGIQMAGNQNLSIDVEHFSAGLYQLIIQTNQGNFSSKFIKE
jgi:hypothetical protein